jgi:hypothetical protein
MFCPRCGSNQSEELKFCKVCGANLHAVRQVVDSRETEGKFDWSKTWVADMFLSGEEAQKRQAAIERQAGITPAVKRYNEIKAGVITGSVGLALMLFLHFFMEGIIAGGKVPPEAVQILARVWLVGVIPLFVGLALLINGVFISKKQVELATQSTLPTFTPNQTEPHALRPADTTEFTPANFSVTEETTKHLRSGER